MTKEVNILHLSDLHIEDQSTDGQNEISTSLQNLICDITITAEKIDELIIVVSGDIAYKAKYKEDENTILKFFKELKDAINSKIKGIIIVPGNHDIIRGNNDSNIIENKKAQEQNSAEHFQFLGYEKYIALVNKIRKIFDIDSEINKTYGVEVVQCNGVNVGFECIDTAWSSFTKAQKGETKVGTMQLDDLNKEYKNTFIKYKKNNPISLTIGVSHYPLNWLDLADCNDLISSMMDINFLNTDILLCGHIHESELLNYVNHEHSLITLATGVGWGINKPSDAKDQHRYSIYQINIPKNTCEIIMRRSQKNQKFDYDYTVYTEDYEKTEKKIVYPLRMNNTSAFIKVNAFNEVDTKNIQVSDTNLELIKRVAMATARFRESCSLLLEVYKESFSALFIGENAEKNELISNVFDFLYQDSTLNKTTEKVWKKCCNSSTSLETFESFLRDICSKFIIEFEEVFPKDTIYRAHFRKHCFKNNETDEYRMICEDNNSAQGEFPVRPIPWGGLIEGAYKCGKSLIYTANKKLNTLETSWDDFVTIIPDFEGNDKEIRLGKGKNSKLSRRPVISFGISLKNDKKIEVATSVLAIICFLELKKHISYFIDEYIRLFYFQPQKAYQQ